MPTEVETKEQRQHAIRSLLRRGNVRRQGELVARLAERGIEATQSSVSRDLREIGVAKLGGRYVLPAPAPGSTDALSEIAHAVREIMPAGPHLTVVTTLTGAAQTVGVALDRARWPEIVGTLAGDDTVFVATAGARAQTRLVHRLQRTVLDATPGIAR